jgi:L,D-peptidoglycan transpeptidase YkuD (ErfK/YbiS/YcfS/YnhG family)
LAGIEHLIIYARHNWTWGCIALTNQDLEEVYSLSREGMRIEIVP